MEYDFYEYLGFDPQHNIEVNSFYLQFFQEADNILELGPGRGEFMCLLREQGKNVVGVDRDEKMVECARSKGLMVYQEDALEFLRRTQERYGGIFAAHFIEHLSIEEALDLLGLCWAALQEKGVLLLVTPNPASLFVHLNEYWRDPTHVRLYNLELLEFLLHYTGFDVEASGGNPKRSCSPFPQMEGKQEELPAIVVRFRRFLSLFLRRLALGPDFNRIEDRLMALERYISSPYPSNEVYVVGRRPKVEPVQNRCRL